LSGNYYFAGGTAGIRIDGRGIDRFVSTGPGLGLGGFPLEVSFSSGNLSHEPEVTVTRSVQFALGAGMGMAKEGIFDPKNPWSVGTNSNTEYSVMAGYGGSIGQEYGISIPWITYGSQKQSNGANNSNKPQSTIQTNNQNTRTNNQNQQLVNSSYKQVASALQGLVTSLKAYVETRDKKK
jgi:hypothetical protein